MTILAALALSIWIYLLFGHGQFWRSGPALVSAQAGGPPPSTIGWPSVAVVIPARNEAETITATLRSLLLQEYRGPYQIILVDDESTDGTGEKARALGPDASLIVLDGSPRPAGWSGKLWAVAQGVARAEQDGAELILLTDADIIHAPTHVSTLVAKSESGEIDLVSEMVALACDSLAERALVPAFIYFFQLLYPFARVNKPASAPAAAAGGTILVRSRALRRIGGIQAISGALIDDVALARAVKRGGAVWLGHSTLARSLRRYPNLADIWQMIARTAYVQLRRSPSLLGICLAGMTLVFVIPPVAVLSRRREARVLGLLAWAAMAISYVPTLRRFKRSVLWAPLLPVVAGFYTAATIGSALSHHFGRGVAWRGRIYSRLNG